MTVSDFDCHDYLASPFAADGLWDDEAQLFLVVPLRDTEEDEALGFLSIGRPGVDGILFGYRREHRGVWAYHPISGEFQLLASDFSSFLKGWRSGAITV